MYIVQIPVTMRPWQAFSHGGAPPLSQFTISRKNEKKLIHFSTKRSQHNELLDFNSLNVLIQFSQAWPSGKREPLQWRRVASLTAEMCHVNSL